MRLNPLDHSIKENFAILKIQDGGGRHLEKFKNFNIFAVDWQIFTKFGMQMRLDPLDPNNQ